MHGIKGSNLEHRYSCEKFTWRDNSVQLAAIAIDADIRHMYINLSCVVLRVSLTEGSF